jgi:SAM-dependent methyltransferase
VSAVGVEARAGIGDGAHSVGSEQMATHYERTFYEGVESGVNRSAEEVLPIVLDYVRPDSVIDVGCGTGVWLATFARLGVTDIQGVEGPWLDPGMLHIPRERFRAADLQQPLTFDRQFGMVVSLEVAEHLPPESAEPFIRTLTSLGPVVLFSAAVPYQGGYQHVNERWPTYWAGLFAKQGYVTVDCIRPRIWHNTKVEWWYAQNMFFAVKASELVRWPRLAAAAEHGPAQPMDLVHPQLFIPSTTRARWPKEMFMRTLGSVRDKWLVRARREAAARSAAFARWPTN